MEIAPVPHRTTRSEWRRLALGLLVLTPVVLLVLLPAVLGLDRYVVTDDGAPGAAGRGSVVMAQAVAPGELEVGDVVSLTPRGSQERVTREVTGLDEGVATLTGGLQVPLREETYDRVWLSVPWIGYPFVVDGGWVLLTVLAVSALTVALLVGRRRPVRAALTDPLPRPRLPVA